MDNVSKREKEWHDERYKQEQRPGVAKFYSIAKASRTCFDDLLHSQVRSKHVLEYGCGRGALALELAADGAIVTGIDVSEVAIKTAIEDARLKNLPVNFFEMDAENLSFDDSTFDVVFGMSILHHLQLERAYSEVARILKPGGKAYFYEPLGHNCLINLYRTLTPNIRSADEHPLKMKDIELAYRSFQNVELKFFHLSSFLAIAFRPTPFFQTALNLCDGFDKLVFHLPWFRKQAWTVLISCPILQAPGNSLGRLNELH